MIHDVTAYATTSSNIGWSFCQLCVITYTVYEACHVMHEAPTLPQRQLHVALKALFDPSLAEFKSCRAREDQPFWNRTNATNTTIPGSPEPKSGACARKLEPGGVLRNLHERFGVYLLCSKKHTTVVILYLYVRTSIIYLSTLFILWPSLHFPPMYHWKLVKGMKICEGCTLRPSASYMRICRGVFIRCSCTQRNWRKTKNVDKKVCWQSHPGPELVEHVWCPWKHHPQQPQSCTLACLTELSWNKILHLEDWSQGQDHFAGQSRSPHQGHLNSKWPSKRNGTMTMVSKAVVTLRTQEQQELRNLDC